MNNSELILVKTLIENSVQSGKIKSDSFSVEKLTGDASTRRYYRINGKGSSFVVCLDKPSDNAKSNFIDVQNILKSNLVRVPEIYDVDLKKGYVLEEDLGKETLLSRLAQIDSLEDEFQIYNRLLSFLDSFAKIDCSKYPNSIINSYKFDCEKFDWEIKFSIENLLFKLMKFKPDDERIKILQSEFHVINEQLASHKMVLCHRDFHTRNIMVKNDGELVVIDFQDARPGNPTYDLVSILEDCYYDIDNENKNRLIKSSFGIYESLGLFSSYDEFQYHYSLMTLQRTFKALGSFGYIYVTRNDERYLKYIHAGIERMKRHLFKLENNTLRKNLISILYEH